MESNILKYSLFFLFIFSLVHLFSIQQCDSVIFCLLLLVTFVSLDVLHIIHGRQVEEFTSVNVDEMFKKAYQMFLEIKDKKDIDLKTHGEGYLQDKYDILLEATKLFTKENDIKNYFVMRYLSHLGSLESTKSKYADVVHTEGKAKNEQTESTTESHVDNQIIEKPKEEVKEVTSPKKEENKEYITKDDAEDLIRRMISNKSYLGEKDYADKDPAYYMNKGDLIDRSWENQFVILDTKHWKPYITPPPVCLGKDDSCTPCPTIMHTPYLELKQFDKSRKILSA